MIAARFYLTRSCNDDYVPNYVVINNIKPDARLEAVDAKLEALYNKKAIETTIIESLDERPDLDENINTILEDAKMICDYAKDHNMSIPDAVEYLNSCHSCGNTDIPFGNEYCNEKCRDEFTVFNYPCFKDADCKVCLNYRREENLRREKEYPQHKWYCKTIGCDKEFCDYRDDSYRQEECCDKECCEKECCEKEDERLYNLKRTKWEFRWFGQDTDDENEDTF
jgi:hypothetical protein